MKVCDIAKDHSGRYVAAPDKYNLIHAERGSANIVLPDVSDICGLVLIFCNNGSHDVESSFPIKLGSMQSNLVRFESGSPGFDICPAFVFCKKTEVWYIVTDGNVIFYDDEEIKNLSKII